MDSKKLIEQYRNAADYWRKNKPDFPDVASSYERAATALSTLQAENEKLRAELKKVMRERDAAVAPVHKWEQYGRYLSPMGFIVPPNWRED